MLFGFKRTYSVVIISPLILHDVSAVLFHIRPVRLSPHISSYLRTLFFSAHVFFNICRILSRIHEQAPDVIHFAHTKSRAFLRPAFLRFGLYVCGYPVTAVCPRISARLSLYGFLRSVRAFCRYMTLSTQQNRLFSAYLFAAAMITAKSGALREAPPIRPPSTLVMESSSSAFFAFMLPPY